MDFVGDTNRAWAKERWDELLEKLPNLTDDRVDKLLSALGGIATGMEAISGFLPKRPPVDIMDLLREIALRNLTGWSLSSEDLMRVAHIQKLALEIVKEPEP